MEEERVVKAVQVDFKCPKCADGYLRPTGSCLPMNPPLFTHRCNSKLGGDFTNPGCGHMENFNKTYPFIDYR